MIKKITYLFLTTLLLINSSELSTMQNSWIEVCEYKIYIDDLPRFSNSFNWKKINNIHTFIGEFYEAIKENEKRFNNDLDPEDYFRCYYLYNFIQNDLNSFFHYLSQNIDGLNLQDVFVINYLENIVTMYEQNFYALYKHYWFYQLTSSSSKYKVTHKPTFQMCINHLSFLSNYLDINSTLLLIEKKINSIEEQLNQENQHYHEEIVRILFEKS